MKIAVTSQNRKSVTAHAGRCRNFWIFDVEDGQITGKQLLELPKEQSFHETPSQDDHPLDAVDVLLVGGMGGGLASRMARKGIKALVISETNPEVAVSEYLRRSP